MLTINNQERTFEQAMGLALQHHTAGRLPQAKSILQQILRADPSQPVVLNLLGVISHQMGKPDVAVDLITKALCLKPEFAEAHNNLGNAFTELGKLDEAVASCHKALSLKPDYAMAHYNLGNAFLELGKLDEAVASYHEALSLKPDYAKAHYSLGNAFIKLGNLDEAIASYHKAITVKPDFFEAHINLGAAFKELGRMEEAAASCRQALVLKPDSAEAHCNLGVSLMDLGKMDEALASCHKALSLKPDYAEAHLNLGLVLTVLGRFDEAKAAIDQGFHINHGGPWLNAATFADADCVAAAPPAREIITSTFKLRDTIDQLEYLIAKSRIDPSFQSMADRYRQVLTEVESREEPESVTKLTASQQKQLGSFYNQVIHYAEAPRIGTGTINESLDFKQIEDRYFSSPVSVTTLDDFLTPEALRSLRDFCLESTIFFTDTNNNFVQSRLADGFNCGLLHQMAGEVKERFPRILGEHHLNNMWIYRYNNQGEGVAAHTDKGAVTFNIWISPDDANRIPDRGGLIVYTKEQPYDWNWRYYNSLKYTPAVSREIANFLADADTVTIPHRENRAVLFRSNLFHKSDQIHFRDGFQNRRMNITLLFGKREG